MKCGNVLKLIPLLVEGELGPERSGMVMDHIDVCDGCRREYQGFLDSMEFLGVLREKPDLSPVLEGFEKDVIARFRESPSGPAAKITTLPLPGFVRVTAAAAVLVLLLTAGFMAGFALKTSPEQPGGTTGSIPYTIADKGLNYYPPGYYPPGPGMERDGTDRRLPNTELIMLKPHELPPVQPASYRRDL